MEVRWLDDFIALARARHFSRAADERNVTQPTLSRRIRLLEEEMGTTLIDRNSLPLSLTAAGEVFLAGAEQMTRIARETKVRCNEIREQQSNRLTFATTQTLYLTLYHSVLMPFSAQHNLPIDLNLKSTSWVGADFVNALSQGECDLVLCFWHPTMKVARDLDDERFESLTVAREKLVPVTANDEDGRPLYYLPGQKSQPLPYIGYYENSFMRSVLDHFVQQQPEPPQLVTMNENVHSISVKAMIKEGFGFGWVPKRLVNSSLEHGSLSLAGGEEWHVPLEVRLYRNRQNIQPNIKQLWALLEDALASQSLNV
ncbi:LysR family transcriptional regulator [Oceanospirillum linum]|uniref:LysR family transcriptional regulator n=1 Tax=Oceanospirillum linum TaxID=966 RepID=A0A1T1HDB2_OCELI|nr:LysR family transcriptional regulator [Oceanospirillum linum]OOV87720.1 LysR family transcriptional regulator [Oceanospirillum linum]SEG14414.1 DNA-binding transcriptional regulator, LysR family [Oleiphilus messinensis]SMP10735.1 DNA-binding transcriptional regulator, LysR family [Oceanospirillum linum]